MEEEFSKAMFDSIKVCHCELCVNCGDSQVVSDSTGNVWNKCTNCGHDIYVKKKIAINETKDRNEIYLKALNTFGINSQLGMLMEECAELIQAAHKLIRNYHLRNRINLAEEIADVEIMIEQIKLIADIHNEVDEQKEVKLERLKKLLNG